VTRRILIEWGARSLTAPHHHFDWMIGVDRLIIRGHTETELAAVLPELLADVPFNTPVMIAPDDLVVSQQSVDAVSERYEQQPGVWCGWSNVDFTHPVTNLMLDAPTKPEPSHARDYDLLPIYDVATRTEPFRVGFNGFTLLTMPASMWRDEATRIAPCGGGNGFSSDWSMCYRLAQLDIPITCTPYAYAPHLKVDYTRADTQDAWKHIDLSHKSIEWVSQ
jgi:hypothetical protein